MIKSSQFLLVLLSCFLCLFVFIQEIQGREVVRVGSIKLSHKNHQKVQDDDEPNPTENGKCYRNTAKKIDVKIKEYHEIPFLSICFDENQSGPLYTQHVILGHSLSEKESGRGDDSFHVALKSSYPQEMDVSKIYTKESQQRTIAQLLNSTKLAEFYIGSGSRYLSRGHLVPNSDGAHKYEKEATFYFENVVPQWQNINNGHWKELEFAAQKYAKERSANLTVYTGTWGVGTLKDEKRRDIPIYLGRAKNGTLLRKVPMPRFMWKILLSENHATRKSAVAFLVLNNPYEGGHKQEELNLCKDLCDKLTWVKNHGAAWKNIEKGHVQCCSIRDLSAVVPHAPKLGNLPLLS